MVELSGGHIASPESRAAVHAALADPLRVAVVDELAVSDRAPSELSAALGVETNLLAHHLRTLERAGLVQRRRSAGDGRRAYLHLVTDRLEGLLPRPVLEAQAILFVCTHNSARSQLAAALWNARHMVPGLSAGTFPSEHVHPGAVRAARKLGLDLRGARPRGLDEVDEEIGLVVTVCDQARERLEEPPHVHWSVEDPVPVGRQAAFDRAAAEIGRRVDGLAAVVAPVGA